MSENTFFYTHWFRRISIVLVLLVAATFLISIFFHKTGESVDNNTSSHTETIANYWSNRRIVEDNARASRRVIEESFRSEREVIEDNYRAGRAAFVAHEYDKAASLFRKGAEAGDAKSQGYLGVAYMMLNDYSSGIVWIRRAAEKGHVGSQYNLGLCYNWSIGVIGNADEALYWLQKAQDNGIENAVVLGMFSKQFSID